MRLGEQERGQVFGGRIDADRGGLDNPATDDDRRGFLVVWP